MRFTTTFLGGFILSSSGVALPQGTAPLDPTRGAFSAVAFGMMFEDAGTGVTELLCKPASRPQPIVGYPTSPPPPPPPTGGFATYQIAVLESYINSQLAVPSSPPGQDVQLTLDAISTANDLLPFYYRDDLVEGEMFELDPTSVGQWATIFLSVSPVSTGNPGSWIEHMSNHNEGPGAEIMGFYVDGSALPPYVLPGQVYLEQGVDDYIAPPLGALGKPNIIGLDLAMPHLVEWNGWTDPAIMPNNTLLYFSVTSDCAADLVARDLRAYDGSDMDIDGATILRVVWSQTLGTWGGLEIKATSSELGLTLQDDDLDALAVGRGLGGPVGNIEGEFFLFSHRGRPGDTREQLMVFARDVRDENEQPIGPKLAKARRRGGQLTIHAGARIPEGTEVTAVCSGDPEGHLYTKYFGIPRNDVAIQQATHLLGFSLTNVKVTGVSTIRCVVSGWAGMRANTNAVWLRVAPQAWSGFAFDYVVPTLRGAHDDVFTFDVPLPPLQEDNYDITAFQQSYSPTSLVQSYPVLIRF